MSIIGKVKKYVEEECKKPTSKYGYEPFHFHFKPVAEYAEQLGEKLENKWQQLHFAESKEIIRPKYDAAMTLLK